VKFGTDCPYYHGGKYHGKAMVRPLNKVDEVMEAVKNHVFDNVAVNTRCPDLEDVNVVAPSFSRSARVDIITHSLLE